MDYSEKIIQHLKDGGHRLTKVRRSIIDELDTSRKPLSVPELKKLLESKGLKPHKTSIYRELKFMIDEGLVINITFGDKQRRFELAALKHHHHAVCEQCGAIEDIDCSSGIREIEKKLSGRDFQVNSHLVEFMGLCKKCQLCPETG